MYDKLLKEIEKRLEGGSADIDELNKKLEAIIKIKTIQAMDVSAELIAYSRRVSRN